MGQAAGTQEKEEMKPPEDWKDVPDTTGYYWIDKGKGEPELVNLCHASTYEHTGDFEVWECPGLGRYTFNVKKFPHWRWSKVEKPKTSSDPAEPELVTLCEFALRMERIAQANKDVFDYGFDIELKRRKLPQGGFERALFYRLSVKERAEGHVLIEAADFSLEAAVQSAWKQIEDACATWSYDVVP